MNKSDSIKNIAAALMTFQLKVDTIKKTAENPFFKSKYAPLNEILPTIQVPLAESGLIFSQFPDGDSLTTILMHPESGEWIEASYAMHPVKSDPQSIGSAITYSRRYALCAILALNVDADDDGNAASTPTKTEPAGKTDNLPWLNQNTQKFETAKEYYTKADDKEKAVKALRGHYRIGKETLSALTS